MRKLLLPFITFAILLGLQGCESKPKKEESQPKETEEMTTDPNDGLFAEFKTNRGIILIKLGYGQGTYDCRELCGIGRGNNAK